MGKENKPEDLGIKVGTEAEVVWTRVKRVAKILIKQSEDNLMIQKEMLKLAEEKIKEEKEKV